MDRPPHEYGPPMAYGQQQQQQMASMQPQYGFNAQHQQFGPSGHGGPPPFMQPHPSLQQFAYSRPMQQAQMYPHPPHAHFHQQGPPPPHSFPSHMPPHLMSSSFNGQQYEPAPAPPPSDPELQKRIDKLVEYAIKNGPEFEAIVREREQDNPAYGFLFGGEGHSYYRYKLFLATRPSMGLFNPSFPSSMPAMHTPPNPMMNLGPVNVHVQQQPPFGMYYDQQHPHPSQALVGLGRPEYDQAYSRPFKGLSRLLPSDVEMELNSILNNLTGTKESIKGAKTWFMQRSPFVPALAEVLRDRVFSLDDSERQLHIVYLANDILFDSLQRRVNPQEIDNEALAFKPVLGCMLARIYHNPQNKEENQSRLQKILQFWASKEVYDQDTIFRLENEMMSGLPPHPFPGLHTDSSAVPGAAPGMHQMSNHNPLLWPPADKHMPMPDQDYLEKQAPPIPLQQFHPTPPTPPPTFASALPPTIPQPTIPAAEKPPPYPLFPPGLIPGMVRKMQIGSGVPYSPMSPLDIPTVIPPSSVPASQVLETVSKFFREIGEINPSVGPTDPSKSDDDDDGGGSYEYGGETPVRKGGACIPPPPGLNADPEGDDDWKPSSSERPGLGVTVAGDPDEPSQYDDVYSSYRKQRSSNYHTSMSARASAR